jgi:hypothetical protein
MSGPALVLSVTDSRTRVVHLVAVETAALHRRSGRYPAMCDTEVITASMLTEPGKDCQDCLSRAEQAAQRRAAPSGWRGSRLQWPRHRRRARPGTPGSRSRPIKRDRQKPDS